MGQVALVFGHMILARGTFHDGWATFMIDGQPATGFFKRGVRRAYVAGSLLVIAAYVVLPTTTGRNIAFLIVSLSAIPGVVLVLRVIERDERRPWQMLLAA